MFVAICSLILQPFVASTVYMRIPSHINYNFFVLSFQLIERERRRRLKFSRKRKGNLKQRFVVAPSVPVLLHLLVQMILQVKASPRELILVKVVRNGSKKVVQKAVKEKQVETTWRQRNLIKETIL